MATEHLCAARGRLSDSLALLLLHTLAPETVQHRTSHALFQACQLDKAARLRVPDVGQFLAAHHAHVLALYCAETGFSKKKISSLENSVLLVLTLGVAVGQAKGQPLTVRLTRNTRGLPLQIAHLRGHLPIAHCQNGFDVVRARPVIVVVLKVARGLLVSVAAAGRWRCY